MKRYVFNVPCPRVWTVYIEAASETQAWTKLRKRQYFFMFDAEGTTPSGKSELVRITDINGGKHGTKKKPKN